MPSDSEKRQFSWRGFRKISAKLPILHALRHICGIGGHTSTEKCLWRFSLQMHCNGLAYFLYGSVASLLSPSSNIEAWPYGTSLRFASLLHLGHQGYENIADYVIIIILLTANLTHLISRNLKFEPIGIESARQHEYYFSAI